MADGIFRRRTTVRPRRRFLGGAPSIRPDSGASFGGPSGLGTSVKRAVENVAVAGGVSAQGTAVKVIAQGGSCSGGAGQTVIDVKAAPRFGTASGGVTAAGSLTKTAIGGGACFAVVDGHGHSIAPSAASAGFSGFATELTKSVSVAGACSAADSSSGQAAKAAPVRGRGYACGSGETSAPVVKSLDLGGAAYGAARAQAVFPAVVQGSDGAGAAATGLAVKVARVRGVCAAGGALRGKSTRASPQGGIAAAGGSVSALSANKITPQAGVVVMGAFAFGNAIVPGPTVGIRTSIPKALPKTPIAASIVLWDAATPGHSTVMVETSVDNGATWWQAVNGAPIPRLLPGTAIAKSVMSRVTLTRENPDDDTPRLHRLVVRVLTDDTRKELVPCGRFIINECTIHDSPSGGVEVEIAGADLARKISRNAWDKTYVIYEGTNYVDAIRAVVTNRMPGVQTNFVTTNVTTPRIFFGEQETNDPWADAQKMAKLIGCNLFFDAMGICTLRYEPDPELSKSRWEFEDSAQPTMTDLVRRISDENTYNMVIVTGEGTYNDVPVRAVARDLDPQSPTYILGPYGVRPLRITSSLVWSYPQAQAAADAMLLKVKGATEAVELDAICNAAIEPSDVVTVTRGKSKLAGRFVVDQMRIPFGATELMHAVGRRQRTGDSAASVGGR
jgi:hypothetical protein